MSLPTHEQKNKAAAPPQTKASQQPPLKIGSQNSLEELLQRAELAPHLLTQVDVQRLQRSVGNQALGRLGNNESVSTDSPHVNETASQKSLQRMLANQPGKKEAPVAEVSQRSGESQGPIVQRYLMNKAVYPYKVVGPDNMDVAQEQKIVNALIFKGEIDGFAKVDTQLSFSTQAVNVAMKEKQEDKDHIYVYDLNSESKKPELQATYEVSDIGSTYNVKTACVLQALINVGATTGFDTAKALHDDLWKNNSKYRLYDLDDVYPQLYAEKGLTKHDGGKERLDRLVASDLLKVDKKYVITAAGLAGGNGHNFCIKVKTIGSGNQQRKTYDLIEDSNNPGGVLDDTRIAEYWSL